ncbi:MAG: winged helix-turn-helix domain-containing protein [Promethearchaeota archaeon]
MPDGEQNNYLRKIPIDDKNRFHLILPNGKEEIIQLTEIEVSSLENFIHLVTKNRLRLEILNILQIYGELNITQLSQKVEQSKSTVARHLKSLEKHEIVISRKSIDAEFEGGKITPKLFRRNQKIFNIMQYSAFLVPEPDNPEERKNFYRRQIEALRNSIAYFQWLLDKTGSLFDKFEDQLKDLPRARETWLKYIDEKTSPALLGIDGRSFSDKYYGEIQKVYKEFMEKFGQILNKQNKDPKVKDKPKEHTAIFAFLPVKDLFEFYKEEKLEKKEK